MIVPATIEMTDSSAVTMHPFNRAGSASRKIFQSKSMEFRKDEA
jgi:hypothetical protein